MEIYLVRHGQTRGNTAHRHQLDVTPLTKAGVLQAQKAAHQIKQLEPTHLLTSNVLRAVETARIIGNECGLMQETNWRFAELIRPSKLYGWHHKSPRSLWFYVLWYLGKEEKKDGESYTKLRLRFREAKSEILKHPNDARVVVVSHAVFIGLFLAHLCDEKALSPVAAALTFKKILSMPNTHIVKLSHSKGEPAGACAWSVEQ